MLLHFAKVAKLKSNEGYDVNVMRRNISAKNQPKFGLRTLELGQAFLWNAIIFPPKILNDFTIRETNADNKVPRQL